ncbi:MAG: phosphotransferase [Clostridia bacterium]|nr:phosphotransferase [Clostridia bacterium]
MSKVYWALFKNFKLVRCFSGIDAEKVDFPYTKIMDVDGTDSILSFNMGSPGVEQKISILGWSKDEKKPFFAKFSQKPKAIELTKNEIAVYKILSNTGLTPVLLKEQIGNDYAFLKTEYVKGCRPQSTELTREIMQLSLTLKDYHLGDSNTNASNLKTALSHGDFCPWNMLEYDGKIRLIDWELAAERPLGHDLFTYIVQTSLLLTPERNLKEAIRSHEGIINEYFNSVGIENYLPYLKEFVEERYRYEISKGNDERANRLNEIIE